LTIIKTLFLLVFAFQMPRQSLSDYILTEDEIIVEKWGVRDILKIDNYFEFFGEETVAFE
jgi:hypothetical protein